MESGKRQSEKKKTYLNPGYIIGGRRCGPGRIWENLVLLWWDEDARRAQR